MVYKVTRNYKKTAVMPGPNVSYTLYQETLGSDQSPRVGGKLKLRPNAMSRSYERVLKLSLDGSASDGWIVPNLSRPTMPGFDQLMIEVRNSARARFVNKIRDQSGSLAVTIASWRQSRDMIVNRSAQFSKIMGSVYNGLATTERKYGRFTGRYERASNVYLEQLFGWKPLIEDIHTAMEVVCAPLAPIWASASKWSELKNRQFSSNGFQEYHGTFRCSISSQVTVSNPNLFLANKLGLINLAGAAWDVVPWSFVVNMFVNANQLVGSVSELVGVSLSQPSRTETSRLTVNSTEWYLTAGKRYPSASFSKDFQNKGRVVTGEVIPPYRAVTKVPKLNWELATMATALLVQRADKLKRFVKFI